MKPAWLPLLASQPALSLQNSTKWCFKAKFSKWASTQSQHGGSPPRSQPSTSTHPAFPHASANSGLFIFDLISSAPVCSSGVSSFVASHFPTASFIPSKHYPPPPKRGPSRLSSSLMGAYLKAWRATKRAANRLASSSGLPLQGKCRPL